MLPTKEPLVLHCLIVDDQPACVDILSRYVERTKGLRLASTLLDGIAAFDYLQTHSEIHLVFLDVEMPAMSGFDFLKMLEQESSILLPLVILTTGHTEYATQGYQFDRVVGFLQKVVSYQNFLEMVQKAQRMIRRHSDNTTANDPSSHSSGSPPLPEDYRQLERERDLLLRAFQLHSK